MLGDLGICAHVTVPVQLNAEEVLQATSPRQKLLYLPLFPGSLLVCYPCMGGHTAVRYVFGWAYCEWTGWKRGGFSCPRDDGGGGGPCSTAFEGF